MASDLWPRLPLGELTENFDGRRVPVKESERRPGPYPYYGASGVVDHVDGYLFDGEFLLIGEDGENLRTRQTPIAFLATGKFWVNNHAHIVRGNDRAHTRYLCYALSQTEIAGYLTGSTIPKLTQANLNRLPIVAPPLLEQRAIASVLGGLDDKIDLNRRMCQTLEELARALFKSWFVDFDPVRAKMEGRDPGLPKEVADLFPNRLVDSELGPIPEGWTSTSLGEVVTCLETGNRPRGGVAGITAGVPSIGAESVVGLGHFDYSKTRYVPREFYAAMKRGRLESRDVLLYKDGGRPGEFEPHVTLFGDGFPFSESCINEHVYRVRVAAPATQNYLYFWLSSDLAMAEMRMRGTGVAIPGLNSSQARALQFLLPTEAALCAFEALAEPVTSRVLAAARESRRLQDLRDTLLPKLISGEVRVPASLGSTQEVAV